MYEILAVAGSMHGWVGLKFRFDCLLVDGLTVRAESRHARSGALPCLVSPPRVAQFNL
jgi:hypothetical protein